MSYKWMERQRHLNCKSSTASSSPCFGCRSCLSGGSAHGRGTPFYGAQYFLFEVYTLSAFRVLAYFRYTTLDPKS